MAKDPLPPPSTTRKSKRKPKRLLSEVLSRPGKLIHSLIIQGAKKWLETHLWHAKRMKMVEKWGIKLKGLRFAYRAAKHECIMHDASYERMIQLRGPESEIVQLMDAFSDPSLPSVGSKQYPMTVSL
ncbi:hypothetical protein HDV02_006236 [Globomyces sp. JEL0801]|nr:hypothetical protein HDV02_006236 [Globomyces sp. JEL0801]